METGTLRTYIRAKFAASAGLGEAEIFENDLTLSDVIKRSDKMVNSVDLMEAFAKTANMLRKEHGLRVRLPTLPLDTPVSKVLEIFLEEAQKQAHSKHSEAVR